MTNKPYRISKIATNGKVLPTTKRKQFANNVPKNPKRKSPKTPNKIKIRPRNI